MICNWSDNQPPGNCHHRQERRHCNRTGQRQCKARTVFRLLWNCSHWIHPRRSNCKQATLQRDPSLSMQFNSSLSVLSFGARRTGCYYMTMPLHITLCLSKKRWQNNRSPFCHILHTHLILHHVISFSFPVRKKNYAGINFSQSRRSSLPQEKPYGTFCKYPSPVFPAAIPTLADLHSGQQQLFWGRIWICVSVRE
jgi:hypothetical protein